MSKKIALSTITVIFIYSACSAEPKLKVGEEAFDNGSAPEKDGNDSEDFSSGGIEEASSGSGGVNSTSGALTVDIENIKGLVVDIVVVGCPGDCFDVKAVATGGNPPYSYEWDDGSTDPEQTLCPYETSVFSVTASDTEIAAEEFGYESQTARAEVKAEVLDCPDGGTPNSGDFEDSEATDDSGATDDGGLADDGSVTGDCYKISEIGVGSEACLGEMPPYVDTTRGSTFCLLSTYPPLTSSGSSAVAGSGPYVSTMKAGGFYELSMRITTPSDAVAQQIAFWGATHSDCQIESLAFIDVPPGPDKDVSVCIQPTKDYSTFGFCFIVVEEFAASEVMLCDGCGR